jgi:OOP family OmpA-OmpF porin
LQGAARLVIKIGSSLLVDPATCSSLPAPANPIAEALENDGAARIYDILFDFDRATLKSSSGPALQQLLEALQGNASMAVDIEGHTDSVGEDAYNLALSQQRAQSVVAWLVDHGVPESRLNAVGKGETQPAASNDTADGRALNRRVEVRRR